MALATAAVVYLPFAIVAGPGDLYDNLVATSLRESDYWSLPFPLIFDEQFRLWPPRDLLEDGKDLLGYYLPLLLVVGLGQVPFARCALRAARSASILAGAGFLVYLLSRTDEFHATPLLIALVSALPICAAAVGRRERVVLAVLFSLLLGIRRGQPPLGPGPAAQARRDRGGGRRRR